MLPWSSLLGRWWRRGRWCPCQPTLRPGADTVTGADPRTGRTRGGTPAAASALARRARRRGASTPMTTVYEAAGGDAGLLALAEAWHARCLADPVASHPFSHAVGHPAARRTARGLLGRGARRPDHVHRLDDDEAAVLRMHAGNGKHRELDALRGRRCSTGAMDDVGLTEHPLRTALHDYFAWSTDRMGGASRLPRHRRRRRAAAALGLGRARGPLSPRCRPVVRGRRSGSRRRRGDGRSPWP